MSLLSPKKWVYFQQFKSKEAPILHIYLSLVIVVNFCNNFILNTIQIMMSNVKDFLKQRGIQTVLCVISYYSCTLVYTNITKQCAIDTLNLLVNDVQWISYCFIIIFNIFTRFFVFTGHCVYEGHDDELNTAVLYALK